MSGDRGVWRITGHEGLGPAFFETTIPAADLCEAKAASLLRELAARHLSPDEVVGANLGGPALEVRRDPHDSKFLTVGDRSRYVAMLCRSPHGP